MIISLICTFVIIILGLAGLLGYVVGIAQDLQQENARLRADATTTEQPN